MIWVAMTLVALAATLAGERLQLARAVAIAKTTASAGFIAFALHSGALESSYGKAILVGLLLSAVGDVCLLSSAQRRFLAGLGAFLLAHVAYCVAFWGLDLADAGLLWIAAPLAAVALVVRYVLTPYIPSPMRRPVDAYILVISAMVTLGVGAWRCGAPAVVPLGAVAFYLSDLSVAQQRFVGPDFGNRLWGLPMYYVGQLLLAYSCTAMVG